MKITPYLNFNGNAKEAMTFYAKCLGGTVEAMFTFGETPAGEHFGPDAQHLIMHASISLPGGQHLFASDAPPDKYEQPSGTYVSINVDDPAEAERIFAELADNGSVEMPIGTTFWAERFGSVADRFGTKWMVNCEKEPATA